MSQGARDESGLLEQPVLLVASPGGVRRELRTAAGRAVGFTRSCAGTPVVLRWFQPVLCVHEEEDQPLVFSVRRWLSLLNRREVIDSEGERVGVVAWPWLLDRWGQPAIEARSLRGGKVLFLGQGREVLGNWTPHAAGLRLEFAPVAQQDPFLQMLLLAAALHAPPGRSDE